MLLSSKSQISSVYNIAKSQTASEFINFTNMKYIKNIIIFYIINVYVNDEFQSYLVYNDYNVKDSQIVKEFDIDLDQSLIMDGFDLN